MGVFQRVLGAIALVALAQFSLIERPAAETASLGSSGSEVTFASPEEGITFFTSALKQIDAPAALSAFAIEGRASGLSFIEMGKRLRAVLLMNGFAPERYEFYDDANRAKVFAEAAIQIRNLTYSLILPPDTDITETILFDKDGDLDALASEVEARLDPARLRSLKLLRTGMARPAAAAAEHYKKSIAGQMRASGGDDLQEWVALYDLDGVTYMAGFTFVQYGERWQILTLTSPLANTPGMGAAVLKTEASFFDLIK